MTTITIPRALLEQALDALEAAKNGLLWYWDTYPDATNDSDDEAIGKIDSALETLRAELAKPEQEESFTPDWANYRQGVADGKAGSPKWHDAPTCAGLWVIRTHPNTDPYTVVMVRLKDAKSLEKVESAIRGARWYGPIPQDAAIAKAEGSTK